jgi:ATP-dependent helicase YprA (DUF1998 family)
VGDHPADGGGSDALFDATAYLYDSVPGGVGLAERIYERIDTLLRSAAEVIAGCGCPFGCPSCVGATVLATTQAGSVQGGPADQPQPHDRKRASLEFMVRWGMEADVPMRLAPEARAPGPV